MPPRSGPAWTSALVTGASSGIGAAFARRLAADGTNLIVVARRADILVGLAKDLESAHGVTVEVLAADLGDRADLGRVEARLRDGDPVDLVVNNAGFGLRQRFWELDIDRQTDEIDLNVTALVHLSHAAIGRMVPAGRGAVINISSVAGDISIAGMSVYTGTKAFVTRFTETLHEELRGTGVTAMVVLPGLTRTNFGAVAGTEQTDRQLRPFFQSADQVAAQALAAAAAGKAFCVTGGHNRFFMAVMGGLPRGMARRMVGGVTRRA